MIRIISIGQASLVLSFISLIATFDTCKKINKPRTVFWSGNKYTYTFEKEDSISPLYFYLGFYIEISDTGETKLMTRKNFNAPKEFYIINLPDSLKKVILSQASKDYCFLSPKHDPFISMYDGFTFHVQFKCDSIDKSVTFIPLFANSIQKELLSIFQKIRNSPKIIKETSIDLKIMRKGLMKKFVKTIHRHHHRNVK